VAFFIHLLFSLLQRFLNWRSFFVLVAVAISAYSMYYANKLSDKLAAEEVKKVEVVAKALETAGKSALDPDLDLAIEIINRNTTVPLIITDSKDQVISEVNHSELVGETDSVTQIVFLQKRLKEYKDKQHKVAVIMDATNPQYVYYGESALTKNLRMFPYGVLGVLFLFVLLLIYFLNNSNRYIQDKVWVGMSKETAHQLGTPLTSLLGWLQLLKDQGGDKMITSEMEKDVDRLQTIANRFSKIGSQPTLHVEDIEDVLKNIVAYMKLRAPKRVQIDLDISYPSKSPIEMSKPLFEWVIENLIRNAIDSLEGNGHIHLALSENENRVLIDVVDTGKGIPKGKWESVFRPGFSTKKRGWGLGLSLSRRIIKEYHRGEIAVRNSELGKGTTFRIVLNKI